MVALDTVNTSALANVGKLLQRNTGAFSMAGVTQQEIENLLATPPVLEYSHYPFKWILVSLCVCVVLFFLFRKLTLVVSRLTALEHRMTAHESVTATM